MGTAGLRLLYASMSCANRKAHAKPAGPPPTMTTSASICGRVMTSRGFRKTIIGNYSQQQRSLIKQWYPKVSANIPGHKSFDFSVSRNGTEFRPIAIAVYRMTAAFTQKPAGVRFEMPDQIGS